ncbi:probable glucan 1,3-beta-glucosidase A [Selaginella moellendorffii]|nr:probable glucan 1,3-beta-glucosidase A [Selaginella moellendorffii]|eukprot:XP_002987782.2 probable glucan 1,3-beta-glucosidase A [Selaginella moellendorffii]
MEPAVLSCMFLSILVVATVQQGLAAASPPNIRAVNLGGWLVIEGWMTMSLFDKIPENNDLLDGTQIQLKSLKLGKYVSAENSGGGKMVVNRQNPSSWETFKLWRVSSNRFYLRVSNNMFVSALNGGGSTVDSTKDTPKEWETFKVVRNKSLVHIKTFNGRYLQAKDESQLTADYSGEPGWDNNNPAVFIMTVNTALRGEFQLANAYSRAPQQVFDRHRNNFITEGDFQFLASKGINAVRIPVGWWIAYDPNPPKPFVGGSMKALDNAFTWASKHNIKVIIDLHAAPGSQNPEDHSASRDGVSTWRQEENIAQTLEVIDILASKYSSHPALLGIELLNEPNAADVDLDTLKSYYKQGYQRVRSKSPNAYVIMCQRLGSDPMELVNALDPGSTNVVLDVHYYNYFTGEFKGKTIQWHINYINNERKSDIARLKNAKNAPLIFVGEWSNQVDVPGATDDDFTRYGTAQLTVYKDASFGWGFWSFKTFDKNIHWDFKRSVEKGHLRLPSLAMK